MVQIRFVGTDGSELSVVANIGHSLMEVARGAGVPGITADCGGGAACATCHVLIEPADHNRFAAPETMEREILEFAADVDPERSRLSCQIPVTEELDGLVVIIPGH